MKTANTSAYSTAQTTSICAAIVAIMLFYAAISKLADYQLSKEQMLNQVFPDWIALHLTWLVPVVELCIATALIYKNSIVYGLYAALILLTAFSIYISLSMTGLLGRIPCSCGGILKHMSYSTHLCFNVCFMLLALVGIKPNNLITKLFSNYKQKGGVQ
jgi:putative oxidoreductase